ncbi:ParB/RepB/Spo0J family partition protein [Macrococcus armenti]|uniref:ParB/RepB/Spo0J family partition protein n=1 Tax=Macrococcus armenti TaxID=2875764 RepID=UPI001CCCFC22|nr:ParB/RepB/Spo0J family partition protein [Macrococcus armenti]UBH15784.1 ParB/RepB/Spo0J family partition protein [Macrococcus armenti]UBH18143.1 ParB/RepB/Spo0J family partition protein [Macrococcus armenti]UBH20410.1 ParB/RepB/Spo0J family partition protein [Macrococcus armenti]
MKKLNLNELIKLDRKEKLTVDGHTENYQVYKIKLSDLYYNDQNDRIASWMSKYKSENDVQQLNFENREVYNDIVSQFIIKSNENAFKSTKKNIELIGQEVPAVVLMDGRIIDGNRRFTCLREIEKETKKTGYIEAIVLEKDVTSDQKAIKLLELYLQHGREERVGYNPVDRLVGVYKDIVQTELLTVEEYAKTTNLEIKEVNDMVKRAKLMVEFLEFINMPEQYHVARDLEIEGPIREIEAVLKKAKDDETREDVKNIIFASILMKPKGDITRYIRDFKNIINSTYQDEFIEKQMDLTEKVLEKIDEAEEVNTDFINHEVRSQEEIKDEMLNDFDKYQERLKKNKTLNSPATQLEKAILAIENIDTNIIKRLNDDGYHKLLDTLTILEDAVSSFKEEVTSNGTIHD